MPSNSFNKVIWAPEGQYFVVASVAGSSGDLLFAGLTANNKLEILHKDEHYYYNYKVHGEQERLRPATSVSGSSSSRAPRASLPRRLPRSRRPNA